MSDVAPEQKVHPLVMTFGETLSRPFPLILVLGREANTSRPIGTSYGPYDFRCAPSCAFWNIAYSTAASTVGLTARALKHRCVTSNASPIAFADSLPIGIADSTRDKNRIRRQVPESDIAAHLQRVFAASRVLDRTLLVLTSGIDGDTFAFARHEIEQLCRQRSVPLAQLPFFYGNNAPKIRNALSKSGYKPLQELVAMFLEN